MDIRPAYALAASLSAVALAMTGCSGSAQPAPTVTVTVTASGSAEPSASEQTSTGLPDGVPSPSVTIPMGQMGDSNGLKMTIDKVTSPATIRYEQSGKTIKPPAGGKYVLVYTHGINDTKEGIDLTCSLPVIADLYDTQGRKFSGVNDIDNDEIKGNPGCNDNIQPGFPFTMIWAYMIPATAEVLTFQFNSLGTRLEDGPIIGVQPLTVS